MSASTKQVNFRNFQWPADFQVKALASCVLISIALFLFFSVTIVLAQDSSRAGVSNDSVESTETVSEVSLRGEHYDALVLLYGNEESASIADKIAGARSAWALGLVDKARELWGEVLAHEEFQGVERSRTMLSKAILELQESNYEEARAIAELSTRELDPSELRAQFWLVIGESLRAQGAFSLAEQYYKKAAGEGDPKLRDEALFLLGKCQLKLGMVDEARYNFAEIEVSSEYTSKSLLRLIEIDLAQRNYEGVMTWVEEGRASFPETFFGPWVHYASIKALLELKRESEARKELERFRVRHSDKNSWFVMAQAAVEGAVLQDLSSRARLKRGGNGAK